MISVILRVCLLALAVSADDCPATVGRQPSKLPTTLDNNGHLLVNNLFTCDGKITAWQYYRIRSDGIAYVSVWRQIANWVFTVVHKTRLPEANTGQVHVTLPKPIAVRQGDFIGIHYPWNQHFGVIAMANDATVGVDPKSLYQDFNGRFYDESFKRNELNLIHHSFDDDQATFALRAMMDYPKPEPFQQGSLYYYDFSAVANGNFMKATDSKSGYQYKCRIKVTIPAQDEIYLEVGSCSLQEHTPDGTLVERGSLDFSDKLKQYAVHIKTKDGAVVPNGITVDQRETIEVLNIKRAMISAIMFGKLDELSGDLFDGPKTITDIYGECTTTFTDGPDAITSDRDLAACKQTQLHLAQFSLHSNIKQLNGGFVDIEYAPFSYDWQTTARCTHTVENDQLKEVDCAQSHKLQWLLGKSDDELVSLEAKMTYNLKLAAIRRDDGRPNNPSSTRNVGIRLEFEDALVKDTTSAAVYKCVDDLGSTAKSQFVHAMLKDTTSAAVYQCVDDLVKAFNTRKMEDVAKHFDMLVQRARGATASELRKVFDTIKYDAQRKAVMTNFYMEGLKSCGSQECVSELVKAYLDQKVGGRGLDMMLVDIMMNHDPAPATVGYVLDMCKQLRTDHCLMLLSGMVRNYALKQPDAAVLDSNGPIYKSLDFVREVLGDQCIPNPTTNRPIPATVEKQRLEILTALKSVGNLGHIIQTYDQNANREIIPAVLSCIMNPDLSEDMVKAAIVSLHKMNINPDISDALFAIVEDQHQKTAYRAAAFNILVRDETQTSVDRLHDLILAEKSTNMRNFFITYVRGVIESQEKSSEKIIELWTVALNKDPTKRLPELDPLMFHKSRYTRLSRQFVLPISQKNIGLTFSLNVVYEPGSYLARSIAVNVSLTFRDTVYNVLEVGGEFIGFETVLEAFARSGLFSGKELRESIVILAGMAGQDMADIRKMVLDAAAAKKAIEDAKAAGLFATDPAEIDERILLALPWDFDPSIIPAGVGTAKFIKQLKVMMQSGTLPPNVDKAALAGAIAEVEAETGAQDASDLPPGIDDIINQVNFKPEYDYVKAEYRNKHKELFDDVNYPRLSFPTGNMYIKTMGNEICYTTIEDIIKYLNNFASTEKIKEYLNFGNLFLELTGPGKKVLFTNFQETAYIYFVIPSIIGVPTNMSLKVTRVRVVEGHVNVAMNIKKVDTNIDINARAAWKGAILVQGNVQLTVPTRTESIGCHGKVTAKLNLDAHGNVNYMPVSMQKVTQPKRIVITRPNHQQPVELLGIKSEMWLKHWRTIEPITGPEDLWVEKRSCTPVELEKVTGRRACWISNFINITGTQYPLLLQAGTFSGSYQILPLPDGVKTYRVTATFSKKPCPMNAAHQLDVVSIKYEGIDANNVAARTVTADVTINRMQRTFDFLLTAPMYNNARIAIKWDSMQFLIDTAGNRIPTPKDGKGVGPAAHRLRKDLIIDVFSDGVKAYGLEYYRIRDVVPTPTTIPGQGTMMQPVVKTTLFGNYTMERMSMQAEIDIKETRYPFDMSADLTAYYFCDMDGTTLYDLHMNPEHARQNGHLTKLTSTNVVTFGRSGRDWSMEDIHTVKYPGQNFYLKNNLQSSNGGSLITRTSEVTYYSAANVLQKITVDSEMKMSVVNYGYEINYDITVDHVGWFKLTGSGQIIYSRSQIKVTMDLDYKKVASRKKRSLTDTLWSVEDKVARGIRYVENSLISKLYSPPNHDQMMSDNHAVSVVDWDNWQANAEFVLNNHIYNHLRNGGYFDANLDVTYPRDDRYHTIKADMKYEGYPESYKPTHGRYNLTFGFESSFLKSGIDAAIGYDGQMFGNKIQAKTYIFMNNLETGEKWPLLDTTYQRTGAHLINMNHNFRTARTNYIFQLDVNGRNYLVLSHLDSSIAPSLDHQIQFKSVTVPGFQTEYVQFDNVIFDYERNMTVDWKNMDDIKIDGTVLFEIHRETYKDTYDGKITGRASRAAGFRGASLKSYCKERSTNAEYFLDIVLVNAKEIQINTHKKEVGKADRVGLVWNIKIVNGHQVLHEMTWGKEFGDMAYKWVVKVLNFLAKRYTDAAITYLSNVNKPLLDKTVPYTDMTFGEIYEEHIKPRIDTFMSELNGYKVLGYSLGETITKYVLRVRAVRHHTQKILSESLVGKTLAHLNPTTPIRHLIGECLPDLIRQWQTTPPPLLFNYWYRSWYPKIQQIRADGKHTMLMSHIFLQDSFLEFPRFHAWSRSLFAYLAHAGKPKDSRGRIAMAMMFADKHVYTFDGRILHIPDEGTCSFLLSSDFYRGDFSIFRDGDKIVFSAKDITFAIDRDNKVYLNSATTETETPIVNTNGLSITTVGPILTAKMPHHGVHIHCDSYNLICRFELDAKHYNHSMGLLGRNDEEYLTDFNLPSGAYSNDMHDYHSAYDLTGSCPHSGHHDHASEDNCPQASVYDVCTDLGDANSNLAPCYQHVPVDVFYDECKMETEDCHTTNKKEIACKITAAYVHMCQARGIDISQHPKCVECGRTTQAQSNSTKQPARATTDYVIITSHSVRVSNTGMPGGNLAYIKQYAASVNENGAKFAVISYDNDRTVVHHGGEFGDLAHLDQHINEIQLITKPVSNCAWLSALSQAVELDYRTDAHRMVLLFMDIPYDGPIYRHCGAAGLIDQLRANSIIVNVFSTYGRLNRDSVLAVNAYATTPAIPGQAPPIIDLPLDEIGEAITQTHGYLFHRRRAVTTVDAISKLLKGHQTYVRRGVCRYCQCSTNSVGMGVTVCSYGPC